MREGNADIPSEVDHRRPQFGGIFTELNITAEEHRELVFFLAAYRYRKTIETWL